MLTTHVVSQGLAEELKRSGWPQEGSTFVWIKTKHAKGIYFVTEAIKSLLTMPDTEWCALPLASELMERMPPEVEAHRYEDADTKNWVAVLRVEDDWSKYHHLEVADTLPDALAKLALHLIQENKLNLE